MRLTLDQYARVSQALALHRISPDAVFAAEQITPEQWEALKEPLELKIADMDPDSELLLDLSDASQRALVWLRRPLPPLDEDFGVWSGFLKAYSESPDRPTFLVRLGLSEVDLMTLDQYWGSKLEDPEARRQAASAKPLVPNIQPGAPRYPVPSDPIGPLAELSGADSTEADDDIPVFGALPTDDD